MNDYHTSDPEVWHVSRGLTFKRLSVILPVLDFMVGIILIGLYSERGSFVSIMPFLFLLIFVNISLITYKETVSIHRGLRKITLTRTLFTPIIRSEYSLDLYDTLTIVREWFSERSMPDRRVEVFGINISVAGGPRYIVLKSGFRDHCSTSMEAEEIAEFFGLKIKDTTT